MKKWIAIASCSLLILASGPVPARGHSLANYPTEFGWKYTILHRVFYQDPNTNQWPNAWNPRAEDAMERWNDVAGSSLFFELGGNASSSSWSCGADHDFLSSGAIDGQVARISYCSPQNSTVRIRLNTADYSWYSGASTPNPALQKDVQASLTHELGHAHQAWLHCTDGDVDDDDPCEGNHYDPNWNGQACDSSDIHSWHTMCYHLLSGNNHWRGRSIEEHDEDLVQGMY